MIRCRELTAPTWWQRKAPALHLGRDWTVALDRIVRIERPDTLKNGALTGLGVGLSLGVLSVASQPRGTEAKWLFASLVSNGVAGMLLGTGIDALFDNRRTLYERGRRLQTRLACTSFDVE